MRLLILGATGRTGQLLVKEGLSQGYEINILVRNRNSLNFDLSAVSVFEGTPTDKEALFTAAQGCEAILSALNISRTSDFPWARLRTPENFLSDVMKNIIGVGNQQNIKRIIIITAWGVSETKKDIPFWFRWLINFSNIAYPYRDHERQEALLKQSDFEWTAVRPAGLTNSVKMNTVVVSVNNNPKPGLIISRQNVAKFAINALKNELYIKECPVISER
jgi:putative NADH-flavin reductase